MDRKMGNIITKRVFNGCFCSDGKVLHKASHYLKLISFVLSVVIANGLVVVSTETLNAQTFNSISQTQTQTNFYSGYTLTFSIKNGSKYDIGVDYFEITFPAGYYVPSTLSTSAFVINNGTDGGAPTAVTVSGQVVRLYTSVTFNWPSGIRDGTITILSSAKIRNPGTAGSYAFTFSGNVDGTFSPSRSISITTSSTTITTPSVSPNTSVELRSALYNINFNTGQGGYLNTSGTVSIVFPAGTTVPEGSIFGVTMNNASTDAVGTSATRTVTIAVPVNIDNQASVQVVIGRSAGIKNPTENTYQLSAYTSSETTPITSSDYSISSADNLSFSDISISNDTVNATANYTVEFVVSNSGALNPAFMDEISLKFPPEVELPSSALGTDVVFTNLTTGFSSSPSSVTIDADSMYFPVPITVNNSDEVRVEFSSGLNILNAAVPDAYLMSAATYESGGTVIDAETSSNPFSIIESNSTLSNIVPSLTSYTASATGVTYTVTGNTGKYGRLVDGTQMIIEFPATTGFNTAGPGTTVVTVEGVSASFSPSSTTLTIDVPASVTIPNSTSFEVIITNVSNPTSNGGYSLLVSTTPEPTDVASSTFNIGATAVSSVTVTSVTPTTVNTAAAYVINVGSVPTAPNKLNSGSKNNQAITVTFPDGTELPSSIANANVTLSGGTVSGVSVDQGTRTVVITVSTNNYTPATITFAAAANIKNPPIPKTGYYTLYLSTSENAVPKESSTFNIAAGTTSPVVNSVTAVSSAVGATAQYTIAFTPGAAGKLVGGIPAGSSTIDVFFPGPAPDGVSVPGTMSFSNVKVNNTTVKSVSILGSGFGGSVRLTIADGQILPASTQANISFSTGAGLVNGATPGTYTVQVATSNETTNSTATNNLTLTAAPTLSVNSISVSPNTVNASAAYNLNVLIGTTVAIGENIVLTFPSNVYLPNPFSKNYILVDGSSPSTNPVVAGNQLTVVSPKTLTAGSSYIIQISSLGGVLNPQLTGSSYVVGVATSHESNVNSPTYSITATTTTVSTPTVSLSNSNTSGSGGTNVTYTINFSSGTNGRLISGTSTITVKFSESKTVTSATIDGVSATVSGSPGTEITLTVPGTVTITNSDPVVLVLNGLSNQATQGDYTLQVKTSVETTYNTSNSYTINDAPPVSNVTFAVSDNVVNGIGQYTLNFDAGVALTANVGTITMTLPTGSVIPGSVATSSITVNVNGGGAVNAFAVSVNLLQRTVQITTPTTVNIGNTVEVIILASSGISNPKEPGLYRWTVKTSTQQINVESADVEIFASTITSISGLEVTVSPQLRNTPVTWTWSFTTGSRGALQAGVGTIYLDFDQSVFTLDPIPLTTIKVMNSNTPSYIKNGSVLEITVPSDVTITNNFPVEVVITASAGIQADPLLDIGTFANSGPKKSASAPSADARIAGTNNYSANTSAETNNDVFVGNPLPIELAYFKVEFNEEKNLPKLTWVTLTEEENYGFIVERRLEMDSKVDENTNEWQQVGFVKGLGYSTEQAFYELYDSNISLAGTYTYRLVQQDFDGALTNASQVEFLFEQPSRIQLYQNYPNPFNPTTTLKYDVPAKQKVSIRIYDIMGRVVQTLIDEEQLPGRYTRVFNANGLASGMYFVRLKSSGIDKTIKITLVK